VGPGLADCVIYEVISGNDFLLHEESVLTVGRMNVSIHLIPVFHLVLGAEAFVCLPMLLLAMLSKALCLGV
jgi:hypothetical protein